MAGVSEDGVALARTPVMGGLEPSLASVGAADTPGEAAARAIDAAPRKGGWHRFAKGVFGDHTLALIDQAVVSGTNFLTTILIARWCGASELGVYSLGFSIAVMWACAQESLISMPYTIFRHRTLTETAGEYAGCVLVHQLLLSALALVALPLTAGVLVLCLIAGIFSEDGAVPGLVSVTWVLGPVIPFAMAREFARRFAFAHLRMAEALVLDLGAATAQVAVLVFLYAVDALSAATTYAAVGASCALTIAIWLYSSWGNFQFRSHQLGRTLRRSWSLGRWLFASQIALAVQGYFIHWLLAGTLGPTATGVYAACLTVVLFSNPLILGISNALSPRTARAFDEGGGPELRRVVLQVTLSLGAVMALFCVAILLGGESLMGFLFQGAQYQGHTHILTVLALAMLATALSMPASNGLTALERSDLKFTVGLAAAVLTVVLVPFLVARWGVTGAAYGFLAGNVLGWLGRWMAFSALVRRASADPLGGGVGHPREAVVEVLRRFTHATASDEVAIQQLSEGAQATIFAARRIDGQPVAGTHLELVVKLYKPGSLQDAEVVRGQYDALTKLHEKVHGGAIHGWRIDTPTPLYLCDRPLALVMTRVPGLSINSNLETPCRLSGEFSDPVAAAVVAALERYWSIEGQVHGDLNFDNILCDVPGMTLSFVDPGLLSPAFLCETAPGRWYPASRDLAYLLYDAGVSVRKTFGRSATRRRQHSLVEGVLRAFAQTAGSIRERHDLFDEIEACARIHLDGLEVAWSIRGAWHAILKLIAARRIDRILTRLRQELPVSPESLRRPHPPTPSPAGRGGAGGMTQGVLSISALPPPLPAGEGGRGGEVFAATHGNLETTGVGPGQILLRAFETLDRAGVPYCVMHGYEDYPERIASDVDCTISADMRCDRLVSLFHADRARIGAEVVRCTSNHIVLAGRDADGSPCFVDLDLSVEYEVADRHFYWANEILADRKRYGDFWVPAAKTEFGCYLVRKIAKGGPDASQGRRLSELYRLDPAGCEEQIARFWGSDSDSMLVAAARNGDWEPVRLAIQRLRAEMLGRALRRRPFRAFRNWSSRMVRPLKRAWRPEGGVHVILLGTDGAGKSSVSAAVRRQTAGAFAATACLSFPPSVLRRMLRRPEGPERLPHELPPRSYVASAIRAVGYWLVHGTVGYYFTVHPALARSTLVVHDRHLLDSLVDCRRYRYAGPRWLLRLIWRLVPKPDLVILLDAPPEVLRARKQEVAVEETYRQRAAYLSLVESLPNGRVADASRPLAEVIGQVNDFILQYSAARVRRRLGVEDGT